MPDLTLTGAAIRRAVAARRDREYVEALAAAVHTTVEVWADPHGYTVELGRAVRVKIDPSVLSVPADPFGTLVAVLRGEWRRYTPDVPPNVELGAE